MKNTKVILNEDVYNLGEEGDVREVAPGYARNFLIPKGLAVPYKKQHIAEFQDRRAAIERRKTEKRNSALGLKERIEGMSLVFELPAGDSGKLFGSVTTATIADRLLQEGLQIERKKIDIPDHTIKAVGEYSVSIKLYADEVAALPVEIKPEGGGSQAKSDSGKKSEKRPAAKEDVKDEEVSTGEAEVESTAKPVAEAAAEAEDGERSEEEKAEAGDAEEAREDVAEEE